eukprot:SAG31_NODE_6201_length_2126_cov_3.087321_2_plen_272_part_00
MPVGVALGGSEVALRKQLPSYKTLAFPERLPLPADASDAVAEGYRGVKLAIGGLDVRAEADTIVELVRGVREAIGDGVELMADAAMGAQRTLGWGDRDAVLALCQRLEPYRLSWLEEPLPCDDIESYAWLIARTSVPIAAGEHEFTAKGFQELLNAGVHLACWQPDIAWCGGMTPLVEIYRLSRRHGVRLCPHRGSEVWSLHAMLALQHGSVGPTDGGTPGSGPELPQLAESGRPWMQFVGGSNISGGKARLTQPDAVGFGVVLPCVQRQL